MHNEQLNQITAGINDKNIKGNATIVNFFA